MKRSAMPPRRAALVRRPVRRGRPGDWPPEVRAAVAARTGGRCEVELLGVCTGPATDIHHRRRRRDGGHTVVNALHCCRGCHAWAHQHPTEARFWGWIVSAWHQPATVPARIRGRRLLLTAAGGYLAPPAATHRREGDRPL